MNIGNTEVLEELLASEYEDLLVLLGSQVCTRQNLLPMVGRDLSEKALEWLNRVSSNIRRVLCSDKAKWIVHDSDSLVVVSAVMDALSSIVSEPALATVSVLIVKKGISRFCSEDWT